MFTIIPMKDDPVMIYHEAFYQCETTLFPDRRSEINPESGFLKSIKKKFKKSNHLKEKESLAWMILKLSHSNDPFIEGVIFFLNIECGYSYNQIENQRMHSSENNYSSDCESLENFILR